MRTKRTRARDIPSFPDWNKALRFPKASKAAPVVFMFQPTRYKVVTTPEELRLWEKLMVEHVGLEKNSPMVRRRSKKMRPVKGRLRGRETISGKAPMTMDD